MRKKIFLFFAIALIGFAFSLNFTGCKKKEKPKDAPGVEESTEDDVSDEENNENE